MSVLRSQIQVQSPEFRARAEHHRRLAGELEERMEKARQGSDPELRAKHESRGKLLVRDRVAKLLDPGSTFLELSPLAAWDLYEGAAPGAGIVTGVGIVHGR